MLQRGAEWLGPVSGDDSVIPYNLRLGVSIALSDRVSVESLDGTVHATDAASVGAQRRGTDSDLEVSVSQKLGGPPPPVRDRGEYERASVRNVHALRLGYDHQRSLQRTAGIYADNRVHALSLGYGWGTHWNLLPHEAANARSAIDASTSTRSRRCRHVHGSNIPVPADARTTSAPNSWSAYGWAWRRVSRRFCARPKRFGFGYSIEVGAMPAAAEPKAIC